MFMGNSRGLIWGLKMKKKAEFSDPNWLQLGDVVLTGFRVGQNLRLI